MSSSRIHSLFTMTNSSVTIVSDDTNLNTFRIWWSQTGSNRRPEACKATALPTELWPRFGFCDAPFGAAAGRRFTSLRLGADQSLVGLGGFEPPTSRLSSARSNQLSYRPKANRPKSTGQSLAWPRMRRRQALCSSIPRIRPERERETKTAKFRMSRPDWPLLF